MAQEQIDSDELLKKIGEAYRSRNYNEAFMYATQACDAGNYEACGALGNLYSSDIEELQSKRNLNYAAHAYYKACEGNIAEACFYLGVYHVNGYGVQQSYSSARGFFARACELNDADGCDALANFYASPNKQIMAKQDYAQAASYYLKACERNLASSCFKLATLYKIGQGVKGDDSVAKAFYGKSCQLGDTKGCEAWWSMENVK